MSDSAYALFLGALLLGVGAVSLLWPEKIQAWAIRYYESQQGWKSWNPVMGWMRSWQYVVTLRAIGALGLAMGATVWLLVLTGW